MKNTIRRALALLLCLLLGLTLFPGPALAEGETEGDPAVTVEEAETVPEVIPEEPEAILEEPEIIPEEPEDIPEGPEDVPAPLEKSGEALEPVPAVLAGSDLPEVPTEEEPEEESAEEPEEDPFPLTETEEVALSFADLDDGTDPEALLDAYAEQVITAALPRRRLLRAAKNSGYRLPDYDREIYAALRELAVHIAAGEQDSPVAVVTVTQSWTAEDLGVSALYVDGSYNAALAAARARLYDPKDSFGTILRCLLADCPYEMYWFDKTSGGSRYNRSTSFSLGDDTIDAVSEITVTLAVSADYARTDDDKRVDTSRSAAVHTAVARAQEIAASYAGYAAYARLAAYRDAICELTAYNNKAAVNPSLAYGDPWQLIWVFDGDASTTVVCEGYSKAFQYLCDLSARDDCVCYTVTGDMARTGGSRGGHMWNIVTMDDGRNYLVDVTNCDAGTVGYPDLLFLKGAEGDAQEGYSFPCGGSTRIDYWYDVEMFSVYTEAELTLSALAYGETPAYALGDVDHSNAVNADDALQLLRYLSGELTSIFDYDSDADRAARLALGDMDGDGSVTEQDAELIQRLCIGLDG